MPSESSSRSIYLHAPNTGSSVRTADRGGRGRLSRGVANTASRFTLGDTNSHTGGVYIVLRAVGGADGVSKRPVWKHKDVP